MSRFDGQRLTNTIMRLDVQGIRAGWYADKYFDNIRAMLFGSGAGGGFQGQFARDIGRDPAGLNVADLPVEMQLFTRRRGQTVVAGVDAALTLLRHATGRLKSGLWQPTWQALAVAAVQDGDIVTYHGDPLQVQPVLRIRGPYTDFGLLETNLLGYLARASRVATQVYETLIAARGKPILFFPARFDLPDVQAVDGYAYAIGVARYNHDFQADLTPAVSTDAQGAWWGGHGGGTLAHAAIACYLGDTAAATLAFAEHRPVDSPRVALVDFNNDSVTASRRTLQAMYEKYAAATSADEAQKYVLFGVRLDTSGSQRDESVPPLGAPELDLGVNPRLVFAVRAALDTAWETWDLPTAEQADAAAYCRQVKIIATGGFDQAKIARFEKMGVPVDIYGVGSAFMRNDRASNSDFTADIVRVQVDDIWHEMAKVGRAPGDNADLAPIDLAAL